MRNSEFIGVSRSRRLTPAQNPRAQAKHSGFTDFMNGNPFCTAYDSWDKVTQLNYETGRKIAALMSRYTDDRVKWARNAKLSTVRKSVIPAHLWGEWNELVQAEQTVGREEASAE